MKENKLARVWVHESLEQELKIRKEEFEKQIGYPIAGGLPVISEVCAEILRQQRMGKKDKIVLEVRKIKGIKKSEILIL